MIDKNAHRLLALFGDSKPHSFFETLKLGCILLRMPERRLEKLFKRTLLENGWVSRLWQSYDPRLDFYTLTPKGDRCFRAAQIAIISRGKHSDAHLRHYQLFNREVGGKYGVEGMGEAITEKSAGLREKYPHLYE